eukprot:3519515-Rhodomonas_salina.1
MLSCSAKEQSATFFGREQREVGGELFFSELLASIAETTILVRDAQVFYTERQAARPIVSPPRFVCAVRGHAVRAAPPAPAAAAVSAFRAERYHLAVLAACLRCSRAWDGAGRWRGERSSTDRRAPSSSSWSLLPPPPLALSPTPSHSQPPPYPARLLAVTQPLDHGVVNTTGAGLGRQRGHLDDLRDVDAHGARQGPLRDPAHPVRRGRDARHLPAARSPGPGRGGGAGDRGRDPDLRQEHAREREVGRRGRRGGRGAADRACRAAVAQQQHLRGRALAHRRAALVRGRERGGAVGGAMVGGGGVVRRQAAAVLRDAEPAGGRDGVQGRAGAVRVLPLRHPPRAHHRRHLRAPPRLADGRDGHQGRRRLRALLSAPRHHLLLLRAHRAAALLAVARDVRDLLDDDGVAAAAADGRAAARL